MTSMIDVVFLLIIFFLVSSSLIRQEVSMEIDLPSAVSGKMPEETRRKTLTLNVPESGSLLIGTAPIRPESLRAHLAEQARDPRNEKGLEVRIRTARHVPYSSIEPILRECAQTGLWDVSFSVYERQ